MDSVPMRQVLIFWWGFQGRKYIEYFQARGYVVDVVTLHGVRKMDDIWVREMYTFDDFLYDMSIYDYIVVAVAPVHEQDRVIRRLLSDGTVRYVIIEKPVTYDVGLLCRLERLQAATYFIDEVSMAGLLFREDIRNISIRCRDVDALEHAIWLVILRPDFPTLLAWSDIIFDATLESLYLIRCDDGAHEIVFGTQGLFLDGSLVTEGAFHRTLDAFFRCMLPWSPGVRRLKKHFRIAREYIQSSKKFI